MKRIDKLRWGAKREVAKSKGFDRWVDLVRYRPAKTKLNLESVARDLYQKEVAIQFAGWWVLKRKAAGIELPFPSEEYLEEFLGEGV